MLALFDAAIPKRRIYLYAPFFGAGLVGEMKKTVQAKKEQFQAFTGLPTWTCSGIDISEGVLRSNGQAVVNAGITFRFRCESGAHCNETEYFYENGILDYIREGVTQHRSTAPHFKERDRSDMDEYKVKISAGRLLLSNQVDRREYYHNSSCQYGRRAEKAVKNALLTPWTPI